MCTVSSNLLFVLCCYDVGKIWPTWVGGRIYKEIWSSKSNYLFKHWFSGRGALVSFGGLVLYCVVCRVYCFRLLGLCYVMLNVDIDVEKPPQDIDLVSYLPCKMLICING